jgi:hypothetical protein
VFFCASHSGSDIQDVNTAIAEGKNAVENNNLARAAWYLVRPIEIGGAVSINAVDVLMAEGLTAAESKAFLESLNLEQRRLIKLALVDPMGDGFFEDAVLKTYERYYNDYLKEKDGKGNNTLTGVGSSSAGGASGLPPDDDDDKDKSKTGNKSESSSDNQQNRKDIEGSWDKGTFDSPEGSLKYHFDKHGKEVGALTPEEYLHKAKVFSQNLKGARKVKINTPTYGVIRYYKNGKYLDKLGDKIISFGKQ